MNKTPKGPRRAASPSYNYLSLEEVLAQYPVEKSKFVCIYAVISSYDHVKGTMYVCDETRRNFQIFINPCIDPKNSDEKRLPIRPGDIIRIHRLALFTDYTRRCPYVKNVVIFEAFKNHNFKPLHLSKNPTIEECDLERVQSLSDWHNRDLLEGMIREKRRMYTVADLALQVLCTLDAETRTILACWNGTPLSQFPCSPLINLGEIQEALARCRSRHLYTNEYIMQLYEKKQLVFISVYGVHRVVTQVLQPLDTIVIYNLLIKPDKFHYGMYSYLLHEGYAFGRTIRVADYNSEIANKLRAQVEGHCFLEGKLSYENYNFDHSVSQIMSPSRIFESDSSDDEQSQTTQVIQRIQSKANETESEPPQTPSSILTFISTLDETSLEQMDCFDQLTCTHLNCTSEEKTIIYRQFGMPPKNPNVPEAVVLQSFSEIKTRSESVFRIQARFHSLIFEKSYLSVLFESISNLRRYATVVQCTSSSKVRQCLYRASFTDFISTSKDYHIVEGDVVPVKPDQLAQCSTSSTQLDRLICPQCSLNTCIVTLDFMIILQDYENSLLYTQLTGPKANILFSCSTSDFCSSNSNICTKIPVIFKYMFHITNDHTLCSSKIDWTLETTDYPNEHDEKLFQIVDFAILSQTTGCGVATIDQSVPLISSTL